MFNDKKKHFKYDSPESFPYSILVSHSCFLLLDIHSILIGSLIPCSGKMRNLSTGKMYLVQSFLCSFSSVVDPDPHSFWSAGFGSESRRVKISHKSEEITSFVMLNVIFREMKTSLVAWTSFVEALG